MKRFLMSGLMVAVAATVLVGCGDDEVVNVDPKFAYKQGEVYTYDYYDRDTNNARVEASKRTRVWTVISLTSPSAGGQEYSAAIDDVTYGTDGTTIESRDTIYVASQPDGEVWQYDLIGSVGGRFQSDLLDTVLQQIPQLWTKITSWKDASPLTWASTAEFTQPVSIVIGTTTIQGTVTGSSQASHQGKLSQVVPAGTYPNAYATDHQVYLKGQASGLTAFDDSVAVHYGFDITDGLLMYSLDSKAVPVTVPLSDTEMAIVTGFEMHLKSVTRP